MLVVAVVVVLLRQVIHCVPLDCLVVHWLTRWARTAASGDELAGLTVVVDCSWRVLVPVLLV